MTDPLSPEPSSELDSFRQEALTQLRRVIEAVPDHRLEMCEFMDGVDPHACSTTFCAAGWAALDPWFQEHRGAPGPAPAFPQDLAKAKQTTITAFDEWKDDFDGWIGFRTLASNFGLTDQEAQILFGGNLSRWDQGKVSKKEVLDRIDDLLQGKRIFPYLPTK